MTIEFQEFYESNIKLLKKNQPNAWKTIQSVNSMPVGKIVMAKNGKPNLKVETQDGQVLFFHDIHDPGKDAQDFLRIVPETAKGTVIFQGMGLGFGPLAIIEKRKDIQHLIVFELCVGIFLQALRVTDLSRLLDDPKVIICLGPDPEVEQILSAALQSMRLEEISMLTHNPSCLLDKDGYEKLGKTIYSIANQLNISSNTFKSHGATFISNRLSALSMIHHTSLIDSLKGRFKDIPAILVAAGPSLDKNIQRIREFKEKAVIISVDAALPALQANGVTPDFVTSIDYQNITYEKIASCAPKSQNISLICSSWVGQKVAKVFPARNIYWTFTGGAMENWINKGLGGNLVSPGAGTVAHLNFVAAVIMGCSPIVFTGQDLAFSEKEGANDHVKHTVLKSDDQTAIFLKNRDGLIWVDGNNGGKVPTSRAFVNYIDQFEKMIHSTPGEYINASEGGAFIKGTNVMRLKEVLDQFCTKEFNISKSLETCNKESKIGDLDAFLTSIKSVLKTVNEMNMLIKKADNLSSFLSKQLLKLKASPKKYAAFDALPQNIQKKVGDIDRYHKKIDKKKWFWGLFDEATVTALQATQRMKYEINKLQDIPDRYIEWLLENLKRLEEVNRVRKNLIKGFKTILSNVVEHHKKERSLLKSIHQSEENFDQIMDLARLYCESGDFVLAKPVLTKLFASDPDNAEVNFYLGKISALHTEYEKADLYFKTAADKDPEFKEKINGFKIELGNEYLAYATQFWQKDKSSAKNMILKGLRFCPDHPRLNVELSEILKKDMEGVDFRFESGKFADISPVMDQWLQIFQNQPDLYNNLNSQAMGSFYKNGGKFFQVSNELLKAFEYFHKALVCSKDNPEYYLLLSEVLFDMGKNDIAVSHYKKAFEIDKAFAQSFEDQKKIKGPLRDRYNKTDEIKKTEACMKLTGEGDRFFHQGKFEDAAKKYEKALLLDAANPYVIHNLGTALKELGALSRAISCYEQTLLIVPEYYPAYYNLGIVLQDQGKIDEAIALYKRAVEIKPDFLNALNNLGNAYHLSNRFFEAMDSYKKILEIDPGYADALNNLGAACQEVGMLDEAILYYKQFLELKPDNFQARANLNSLL
ncbi:6-hydroxymethylpterin diphosphokinase MptE-like protein [Desulfobacula sp.]|uniref:6-hydroxymethylpterin diphosphokinase MptE-like protein n=1 Tax=Desulfobacula sp. TaxID=2593537 RepID=UPI0026297714|nr:6-hydroxymethylpterin diphosphokinase MptE-like protein [Desulfobacula sp.]